MAVFIDDQAIDLAGDNLATLLQAAQHHLETQGKVIVEVQLGGETLVGDNLVQQGAAPVAQADELRLYSAQPDLLAVETLEQVRAQLHLAGNMQQEAADLLQADQGDQAMAKLGQAIEAWLQVQQVVVMAAELARVDLETIALVGQSVDAAAHDLIEALKNLKELITANDTVTLADALAYEWPELTDQWDRLVEALIEEIEKKQ